MQDLVRGIPPEISSKSLRQILVSQLPPFFLPYATEELVSLSGLNWIRIDMVGFAE
jgi:hypothetical protein